MTHEHTPIPASVQEHIRLEAERVSGMTEDELFEELGETLLSRPDLLSDEEKVEAARILAEREDI